MDNPLSSESNVLRSGTLSIFTHKDSMLKNPYNEGHLKCIDRRCNHFTNPIIWDGICRIISGLSFTKLIFNSILDQKIFLIEKTNK
jgi:hypothetical protein